MTDPELAGEVQFAELGPATRLAVKTGLAACYREGRLLEEKLSFARVRGSERAHYEHELAGWNETRVELLSQTYPPPYKPGQPQPESAGGEESPRR